MDEPWLADEESIAAMALCDILASVLMRAYETQRNYLYCWERDGLRWLIRFRDRRPDVNLNDWTGTFLRLNRKMILSDAGTIDFNLRAFRERGYMPDS